MNHSWSAKGPLKSLSTTLNHNICAKGISPKSQSQGSLNSWLAHYRPKQANNIKQARKRLSVQKKSSELLWVQQFNRASLGEEHHQKHLDRVNAWQEEGRVGKPWKPPLGEAKWGEVGFLFFLVQQKRHGKRRTSNLPKKVRWTCYWKFQNLTSSGSCSLAWEVGCWHFLRCHCVELCFAKSFWLLGEFHFFFACFCDVARFLLVWKKHLQSSVAVFRVYWLVLCLWRGMFHIFEYIWYPLFRSLVIVRFIRTLGFAFSLPEAVPDCSKHPFVCCFDLFLKEIY